MKITVSVNGSRNGYIFAAQIAMDITGVDDIGSPATPFEKMVKDNAEDFGGMIVDFILAAHPSLTTADLETVSVVGEEPTEYYAGPVHVV